MNYKTAALELFIETGCADGVEVLDEFGGIPLSVRVVGSTNDGLARACAIFSTNGRVTVQRYRPNYHWEMLLDRQS